MSDEEEKRWGAIALVLIYLTALLGGYLSKYLA
jgi:hypothetical protein